ncbi:hypothetical protein VNO78_27568 [Psophocarpus tetragonolobus]|uniref:Disease resistance RPP13-like protein 4 n=1 Tax=Psophocarpus tetragonolobus TaxID=3891 RepID=A0AAN9XA82_PSOTE
MSIRSNPTKAVSLLLKRLEEVAAEKQVDIEDLRSELFFIKDLFSKVKENEEELLKTLTIINGYLHDSNAAKLMEEKGHMCRRIRYSTQKLLPAGASPSNSLIETFQKLKPMMNKTEVDHKAASLFWSQVQDLEMLRADYSCLVNPRTRLCFHSLSFFPQNAVIKKRRLFFWWVAVGSIKETGKERTVEEEGEAVFDDFLKGNLILPHSKGNCPVVSKFIINPSIRHKWLSPLLQKRENRQRCSIYSQMITSSQQYDVNVDCLALDKRRVKLSAESGFKSNHWRAVFNVGASYLTFGPQWLAKMGKLEVLHLGRWQDSASHHIEVESEGFLKELRDQKYLKYVSLRGISKIYKLPTFFFQLESLEILDFKACYNLETLPDDIASLKNLRHLDMSQCYLLERMPKGIEKLTNLQVLKGFLIGNPNLTPCKISDLASLKKLARLSIHIRSLAISQDKDFESLHELSTLTHLKISWGVSHSRNIPIIFPLSLVKLSLEGFPEQNIPDWLKPSKLHKGLKELTIMGGALQSMNHGEDHKRWYIFSNEKKQWYMEIVRLKYLKNLNVNQEKLQKWFPLLRYAELREVQNHSYFEWSK